jgi:hypothetical protein
MNQMSENGNDSRRAWELLTGVIRGLTSEMEQQRAGNQRLELRVDRLERCRRERVVFWLVLSVIGLVGFLALAKGIETALRVLPILLQVVK